MIASFDPVANRIGRVGASVGSGSIMPEDRMPSASATSARRSFPGTRSVSAM